jgi:hypothetical protein
MNSAAGSLGASYIAYSAQKESQDTTDLDILVRTYAETGSANLKT